jgi:CRP/FNR family transcriptional regulator, cyclic AMP receptor protein
MSEKITLLENEYIIKEGEPSTEMYFLIQGKLGVTKVIDGTEKNIGSIDKGQLVGEMSFLDKKTRSASVKAIEKSELLIIPLEKFEKVLEELPDWVRTLQSTLIGRLRKADEKAHNK